MAYTKRIGVRFDDVDFARVVYYPRFFGYTHQTFEDFFADEVKCTYAKMLQERKTGYPSVHASADFLTPLRFGDVARVVLETLEVGKKSLTCRYRIYQGETDVLCAQLKVVTVAIEMDTFKGRELPDDVKVAFERHRAA